MKEQINVPTSPAATIELTNEELENMRGGYYDSNCGWRPDCDDRHRFDCDGGHHFSLEVRVRLNEYDYGCGW